MESNYRDNPGKMTIVYHAAAEVHTLYQQLLTTWPTEARALENLQKLDNYKWTASWEEQRDQLHENTGCIAQKNQVHYD